MTKKQIKAKKYEYAVYFLKEALDADKKNADIYNNLGFAFRKMKKFDKSIFIINKMFKNPRKNPIQVTLSVLHTFFKKLILMNSKDFQTNPKTLGIHPYFLKDYQQRLFYFLSRDYQCIQ